MTLVLTANVVGQPRGEPVTLPNRRRRLSTIVARHRPAPGRNFIVSVHRRGVVDQRPMQPSDATARLKATWSKTLVGPQDVVLLTVVPGRGGIAAIGLSIASIALIALAPYAAPLIAGSALFGGGAAAGGLATAIQAGLVVGGIGLAYAAQASSAAKTEKQRTLYSVSGGGNVPKPGGRKPLIYGKCWSSPPLSQRDYFRYDGDTMILTKRMTLGLGKFQIHQIKVGDAVFWNEGQGLVAPFNQPSPDPASQTAIEFLYEQASAIAVGDAISSGSVAGQELPRVGGNPSVTPWFRLTPQGVVANSVLISRTYPAVYSISSKGEQKPTNAGADWTARRIDPITGAVIGAPFKVLGDRLGPIRTSTAIRASTLVRLPAEGAYEIQGQNVYPDPNQFAQNRVSWDEMVAFKDDVRIRPATTEIVMRVRAGPGLTVTAFSDITVLATRILPVRSGTTWTEQPVRKAVWSYTDLVRNEYGLARDAGADAAKAAYYAGLLTENDTFDGVLPEVASFWENAATILLPLRADPVKVGAVHSFVRDEPQAAPRHILSRRQMVRDSGTATYKTKVEGSDVIVEFDREGDPKRPDEVRYSYGPPTRTPKRYRVAGITDGAHALKHAKWLAGCAVFRGAERSVTTEWTGRLIYPGDHVLSDMWFLQETVAYGVDAANSNVLTLDCDASVPSDAWGYGSIRTRAGRDWGILRVRGQGARGLELHAGDVTALAASTGLDLADVLARESQQPTTVVLGQLSELQQTWVARSAVPSDEDHVQIEMVRDDPRVWLLVDETPIVPAPIGLNPLDEPLIPQIDVLHARCGYIETGIEVIWSVSQTRGARNYEADLSYDAGATWGPLSPFGPNASGRAQLQQSDGPVTVRARAFGRTGLHGDYIQTTFLTVPPIVDGSLIPDLTVEIAKLSADAQKQISDISDLGTGLLSGDQDTGDIGFDLAHDTLRGGMRQLQEAVQRLAEAASNRDTNDFLQREVIRVGTSANFAGIERETVARVSATDALASQYTTLAAQLTALGGQVTGQASAISGLSASVSSLNGTVTSQGQAITALSSRVDDNVLAISGQATAQQGLTTRVTASEGNITSLSQSYTSLNSMVSTQGGQIGGNATAISTLTTRANTVDGQISTQASNTLALQSTVGSHTATLTTQQSSIDGVRVQFGVTGNIDGITGGFVLTGIKKLDGSVSYTVAIQGSLIVTGSVTAAALNVLTVSSITANLGSITTGRIQSPDGKWISDYGNKTEYFYD